MLDLILIKVKKRITSRESKLVKIDLKTWQLKTVEITSSQ